MKIETNLPVVAYHIVHGEQTFNYAVDANSAVSMHPNEWSKTPWSAEDTAAAEAREQADAAAAEPEVEKAVATKSGKDAAKDKADADKGAGVKLSR